MNRNIYGIHSQFILHEVLDLIVYISMRLFCKHILHNIYES